MRSVSLSSESVLLMTHLPSSSFRPKPQNSLLFCLNSRSNSSNSKLYCRNPTHRFSRFARRQRGNIHDAWFRHLSRTDSDTSPDTFMLLDCNMFEAARATHKTSDCGVNDKSPSKDNMRRKNCIPTDLSFIDFHQYLKFVLLCGFFILEGTQQAVAGSDFTNGLLSNSFFGDLGDISSGFASAFLLIFFSELGDKTFFIAALLAARTSAAVVFLGTFGALGVMTIISVILGRTFHYVDDILPFRFGGTDLPVDDIAAVCLLVYFGVSTLLDATSSDGLKAEDEQKEAELAVAELSGDGAGILAAASTVISTFLLVFVAEWGDKSFFSTIALAAASAPLGVIGGALAGHGVATLLAVLGGSLLGKFLSEKVIAYIGGSLFLVFAAVTLIEIVS